MDSVNDVNVRDNETDGVGLSMMFPTIPRFMYRELTVAYNLVGVVFNTILITYFIKSHKYRSPTFMLLTSLAFMDVLTCFSGATWPIFLFPIMTFPQLGRGCQVLHFFGAFGLNTSEYLLVFFAALRFYQLAFPLAARVNITSTFVLKGCLIVMLLITCFVLPLIIWYGTRSVIMDGNRVTICTLLRNRAGYDRVILIISTIIPGVTILLLHIAKYIAVWRSRSSDISNQQRRYNADARAVTIIIILFFIAWFPSYIYIAIQHSRIENYRKMRDALQLVLMYGIFSNSTLNPLVYCFAAKTVRDDVLKLLCPRRYIQRSKE